MDLDLTGATKTYTTTGDSGDLFTVTTENVGSSGTGLINSFLRIQGPGNSTKEQGYNSDRTTAQYDEGVSQTTSLLIQDVPLYNINGNQYAEFLLDTNEGGNELISLNQVQIFVATNAYATDPNLSGSAMISDNGTPGDPTDDYSFITFADDPSTVGTDVMEVFRMSGDMTQYQVLIDSSLGNGSGTYDMRFFFDVDFLASLGSEFTNFIVYTQFGTPPGSQGSGSGFEEWSVARAALIPEPGTWALLLITACGALFFQYRRQRKLNLATVDAADC